MAHEVSLAVKLGFQPGDKVLIVNADDVGMSYAANQATIQGMERGLITAGSIMVPCPWFLHIAEYARKHPKADFGIHLTHTSEWQYYRWGPVGDRCQLKGLIDPQGYLWRDVPQVYANATPEQALLEARAQIRMALENGIDITHLDSHMGTLQYSEKYFYEVYIPLAKEFNLPVRMGSQELLAQFGYPDMRQRVREQGILFPDYLIHGGRKPGESVTQYWKRTLRALQPGVTELYIHPALPTEEMQHIAGSWRDRAEEFRLFTTDAEIRRILKEQDVKLIGWRAIRDLQRQERKRS
ncbi:MAG: polysaccharide deacetylase family protein [Armatimonadota bacterium]|nr:polysaccharide deacetylase family protein [Armatimonadota bacterium]MDW8290608.1 polysaccharide deacetylase family protein [Armatimonadota bacterium]